MASLVKQKKGYLDFVDVFGRIFRIDRPGAHLFGEVRMPLLQLLALSPRGGEHLRVGQAVL